MNFYKKFMNQQEYFNLDRVNGVGRDTAFSQGVLLTNHSSGVPPNSSNPHPFSYLASKLLTFNFICSNDIFFFIPFLLLWS